MSNLNWKQKFSRPSFFIKAGNGMPTLIPITDSTGALDAQAQGNAQSSRNEETAGEVTADEAEFESPTSDDES